MSEVGKLLHLRPEIVCERWLQAECCDFTSAVSNDDVAEAARVLTAIRKRTLELVRAAKRKS
jgi:hypothetical protein